MTVVRPTGLAVECQEHIKKALLLSRTRRSEYFISRKATTARFLLPTDDEILTAKFERSTDKAFAAIFSSDSCLFYAFPGKVERLPRAVPTFIFSRRHQYGAAVDLPFLQQVQDFIGFFQCILGAVQFDFSFSIKLH